jgi:hypothetical protein
MKMRFLALMAVAALPVLATAEPFALRAKIPAEIAESFVAKSAQDSPIPSAERVAIPGYPGAVVIRSYAVVDRPPKYEGLPIVEMISADDYETVINHYKQKLPDWGQAELLSAYYFAEHGNVNFFKPEEPHVGVHKLDNYFRESEKNILRQLLPGAQTLIKVFYAKD